MTELLLILAGAALGGLAVWGLRRLFGAKARVETVHTHTVFEQVRAVGKLVGMEVCAKEIATSTKGLSWLPPLLLSRARVAMIFQFEKQYSVDLASLTRDQVTETAPGRYRIELPPIEGVLRLTDVTPYDIQAGRVLGLLDIIQVDASTQGELMKKAQSQAAELYSVNDAKYEQEARRSIERQLEALLSMFNVEIEAVWPERADEPPQRPVIEPAAVT